MDVETRNSYLQKIGRGIAQAADALRLLRIHVLFSILLWALFKWVPQIHDVMVALGEDSQASGLKFRFRYALAIFFIGVFLPFVFWFTGRWVTMQRNQSHTLEILRSGGDQQNSYWAGFSYRVLPRICAILPLATFAWVAFVKDVFWMSMFSTILIALWLIFLIYRRQFKFFDKVGLGPNDKLFENRKYWPWIVGSAFLFWILLTIFPVWFPQAVGTLPLLAMFLITMISVTTWLIMQFEKSRVPYMTIGFAWAVLLAWFVLTDNHPIDLIEPGEKYTQPLLEDDFKNWLVARKTEWENKTALNKYPIYIFAAEGGGIFAAQNAAFALSYLEDQSKQIEDGDAKPLSHYTYAISGISGGSLGIATFAASLQDHRKGKEGSYQEDMKSILQTDFLSPIAGRLLSNDFLQRFIPATRWSTLPDRSDSFKQAVMSAWKKTYPDKIEDVSKLTLNKPMSKTWLAIDLKKPAKWVPNLVLNTAEISSGRTVAAAPFSFTVKDADKQKPESHVAGSHFDGQGQRQTFNEILTPPSDKKPIYQTKSVCAKMERDRKKFVSDRKSTGYVPQLSLIEAALTSARFPYVSPPGYLTRYGKQDCPDGQTRNIGYRTQYVDGGYVEGSGVEPALIIVKRLNDWIEKKSNEPTSIEPKSNESKPNFKDLMNKVEIHLVTIELEQPVKFNDSKHGTILAPPMGLLATWGARSALAVELAVDYFKNNGQSDAIGQMYRIKPKDDDSSIPLGWSLSKQSSDEIAARLLENKALQIGQIAKDKRKPPANVMCQILNNITKSYDTCLGEMQKKAIKKMEVACRYKENETEKATCKNSYVMEQ